MHSPVNHPLRPVYRALGVLAGVYLVVFGVFGLIETSGDGIFNVGGENGDALGQGTNVAWSIVCIIVGAIVVLAGLIGRNLDVAAFTYAGWTLAVVGTVMLAFIRTQANILNFSIVTVIVTYIVGLVLITAGLYVKVVPQREAGEPRQVRETEAA